MLTNLVYSPFTYNNCSAFRKMNPSKKQKVSDEPVPPVPGSQAQKNSPSSSPASDSSMLIDVEALKLQWMLQLNRDETPIVNNEKKVRSSSKKLAPCVEATGFLMNPDVAQPFAFSSFTKVRFMDSPLVICRGRWLYFHFFRGRREGRKSVATRGRDQGRRISYV
jgi:hypothetical protein